MSVLPTEPERRTARRLPDIIGPSARPHGALTWSNLANRQRALGAWRTAVMKAFPRDARVIKVAWVLRDLMDGGFCFASDRYISEQSGVPLNKVSDALAALEGAGAIIRAAVLKQGSAPERRIWPAAAILPEAPPVTGGPPTPRDGSEPPPVTGGQNNKGQSARTRNLSPLGARSALSSAAQDAELRRRREAGEPMPWDE